MQAAIVVPTYNEKDNILKLIKEVKESISYSDNEVSFVIVDDNSPDGTQEILRKVAKENNNIHLIARPRKMGLGSAYIDAFRWILSNAKTTDIVIQMDADLSHPPKVLTSIIDALNDGTDVVIASRYSGSGSINGWPIYRRMISKGANIFARTLLGVKVKDMTSGFKAFRLNVLHELLAWKLSSKGYEYQVETVYIISKLGKRIQEIPFVFSNRTEGKSKLAIKDILVFIKTITNLRLRPPSKIEEVETEQKQEQEQIQEQEQYVYTAQSQKDISLSQRVDRSV
jgi:dolichol-phosphate mannosyltransferase